MFNVLAFLAVGIFMLFVGLLPGRTVFKKKPKVVGSIDISTSSEGVKVFTLDIESDPEALEYRDFVTFKINRSFVE